MGEYRYPFSAFPNGWYAVGFSDELSPGELRGFTFCGREVVLYRTASGTPALVDAYCPHMGAHFAHGGKVQGENLWCPFHAFEFDTDGRCVRTGYGTRPPAKACMKSWPLRENHGVLLAYHDLHDRAPAWEVPPISMDGWMGLSTRTLRLRSHPQETSENSVDMGHLGIVHGYKNVRPTSELEMDGPHLSASYAMQRDAGVFGRVGKLMEAQFRVHVHGLGYSFVDVHVHEMGLHFRNWVLATPTDGEYIDFRLATSVEDRPTRVLGKLSPLAPRRPLLRVLREVALQTLLHDVRQDFEIWRHKRYVTPPALAQGDGPVGVYRKWCRQFYPELPLAVVPDAAGRAPLPTGSD